MQGGARMARPPVAGRAVGHGDGALARVRGVERLLDDHGLDA